mmetsp:Transcript_303/g.580  ORF Transcript_303/g.580 Transcript_303/m.580 type:complete len:213 (-) Transcript_303:2418-3056(-)
MATRQMKTENQNRSERNRSAPPPRKSSAKRFSSAPPLLLAQPPRLERSGRGEAKAKAMPGCSCTKTIRRTRSWTRVATVAKTPRSRRVTRTRTPSAACFRRRHRLAPPGTGHSIAAARRAHPWEAGRCLMSWTPGRPRGQEFLQLAGGRRSSSPHRTIRFRGRAWSRTTREGCRTTAKATTVSRSGGKSSRALPSTPTCRFQRCRKCCRAET